MTFPYDEHMRPVKRPLSGGERIMRGFRRVGVALALPAAVIGIGGAVFSTTAPAQDEFRRVEQLRCLHQRQASRLESLSHEELLRLRERAQNQPQPYWEAAPLVAAANGCPGPRETIYSSELGPWLRFDTRTLSDIARANFFFWGAITAAISAALFLVPWGLGWILAGFMRD